MPTYINREEQEQLGLIKVSDRSSTRYVPAQFSQDHNLTGYEQQVLSTAVNAAGEIMARRQMNSLAKSDDTAITQAIGSLIYSAPYLLISALITGALIFIGFMLLGGEELFYLMLWLVAWGAISLHYLSKNRQQGLEHSATGIALAEIDSREEVAKYTVDRFIGLIEKKWGVK